MWHEENFLISKINLTSYQWSTENQPKEGVMFNSSLPESFCHLVARQLESNCTLKMFKLQLSDMYCHTETIFLIDVYFLIFECLVLGLHYVFRFVCLFVCSYSFLFMFGLCNAWVWYAVNKRQSTYLLIIMTHQYGFTVITQMSVSQQRLNEYIIHTLLQLNKSPSLNIPSRSLLSSIFKLTN